MKIYRTGHEIADQVALSLDAGLKNFGPPDAAIGYGILRGMAENLCSHEHWFEIDRGYWNPGHYDGNYRISYRGTQAKWHEGITKKRWIGDLEPLRLDEKAKPILFCPPTEHVAEFFIPNGYGGCSSVNDWCLKNAPIGPYIKRDKGDPNPIDWDNIRAVITFNSSVGWEAIRRGIPCLSDVDHSIVGSFYGETDLEKLIEKFHSEPDTRHELFEGMVAHDFTLEQIRRGDAWPLINHYLSRFSSDSIAGNQSPPTFASILSQSAPPPHFQSNT